MSEDTTQQVAPETGTPTDASAPSTEPKIESSAPEGTPERTYAGKYKSADDLEKAYTELQSKIGQKTYAETLGEKVVTATGYSVDELESAGYSPEQIVQAVVAHQDTGATQASNFSVDTVRQTVQESKVDTLAFELEMERFVRKNPEAENLSEWVRKMKRHPDYRGRSVEEIYEEIKPIVETGKEQVLAKQNEKESAGMSITHNPIPDKDPAKDAVDKFNERPNLDNAASMLQSLGIK